MVKHETFRRLQPLRDLSGRVAFCLSRGNAKARSRISKAIGSKSPSSWPEKAEGNYFAFRPRIFRYLETNSFRFFIILRSQLRIGHPLSNNLRTEQTEAVCVVHGVILCRPIVVSKDLLIYVAMQMERLNRNVGSIQSTLEQRPEVLQSVRMDAAIHILFNVVNESVNVIIGQRLLRLLPHRYRPLRRARHDSALRSAMPHG